MKYGWLNWPVGAVLLAAMLLIFVTGCEMPPNKGTCERPQLVAFTASWCGPCKQQAPLVNEIEAAGVKVTRIDIDQRPDLARQYGVTSVPTYFYYECQQPPLRTNQASDVLQRIRRWR